MKTIHRWFPEPSVPRSTSTQSKSNSTDNADPTSFKNTLLDKLAIHRKSEASLTTFDQLSKGILSGNMFGSNPLDNLMNLNINGIQKVWAEQLKSPLPQFSTVTKDKNGESNILGDVIALTVREHMVKARKQLARQARRYEENGNITENQNSVPTLEKGKNISMRNADELPL